MRAVLTRASAVPWPVWVVSLGVPAGLLLLIDRGYGAADEGARFVGVFRWDMLYYLANAREVFEGGNGLFYSDPFSASFESPRVFSHLQLLIFGWLFHATGVPLPVLWQIGHLAFGALMFLALHRLLGVYFDGARRTLAFLAIALGGGGWVLSAAARTWSADGGLRASLDALWAAWEGLRWCPNVLQNVPFTTEAFYHALAFTTLAASATGRRGLSVLGVFLVFWSHPFTGLQVAAIVGGHAVLEAALSRDRQAVLYAAAAVGVGVAFLGYYAVVIPALSVEAADIIARWRVFYPRFEWHYAFGMWGLFLLGPLLALLPRTATFALATSRSDRLLLVWAFVTLGLLLHDRLLPESIAPVQPLHFSHGYMMVALGILTLRGLFAWTADWPAMRKRVAAAALIAIVSLDNVAFTAILAGQERPTVDAGWASVLDFLAAQSTPGLVHVDVPEPIFAPVYLAVVTPHRPFLFWPPQTPFFEAKQAAAGEIFRSREPAARAAALGIRWLVVRPARVRALRADIAARRARVAHATGPYRVVEVLVPIVPALPTDHAPPEPA